jgi:hypothetical protein
MGWMFGLTDVAKVRCECGTPNKAITFIAS